MISATFWGGPKDGDTIALPDCRPLRIPVLDEHRSASRPLPTENRFASAPVPLEPLNIRTIEITPVLTSNGWILPWHEP